MEPPALPLLETPVARREGFLVGAVVGAALAAATAGAIDGPAVRATLVGGEPSPLAPPPGQRRSATALADGLLIELTGGGVDLRRLAGRWIDWRQADGFEADPRLDQALDHLREFDAPVSQLPGGSVAPLAAVLPAALASASPKAMIAGAFHVARLLDPSEATALASVAVVIAAAAFLEGRRDFVPDVIAALRANGAPPPVLDVMRAIPRDPRTPPPAPRGEFPDPVGAAVWVLWLAHHRPRGVEAMREMALIGGIDSTVGAVVGALLGARDGVDAWPVAWIDGAGEEVVLRQGLARRLEANHA